MTLSLEIAIGDKWRELRSFRPGEGPSPLFNNSSDGGCEVYVIDPQDEGQPSRVERFENPDSRVLSEIYTAGLVSVPADQVILLEQGQEHIMRITDEFGMEAHMRLINRI